MVSVGPASEGQASTPKTSSPVLLLSSTDLVCRSCSCSCGVCACDMHVHVVCTRCAPVPGAQHGPARQRRRGHWVQDPDQAVLELAQHLRRQLHLRGALNRRCHRPCLAAALLHGATPLRRLCPDLGACFALVLGRLTRLDQLAVIVAERN